MGGTMYIYIYAYFCITYTSSDVISVTYPTFNNMTWLTVWKWWFIYLCVAGFCSGSWWFISGFCSLILLLGQTILMALPLCHKREYIGSSKNIKITDDYGGWICWSCLWGNIDRPSEIIWNNNDRLASLAGWYHYSVWVSTCLNTSEQIFI